MLGCVVRSAAVLFVSLLRKGTPERDRSEAKLASAFDFVSLAHSVCRWTVPQGLHVTKACVSHAHIDCHTTLC